MHVQPLLITEQREVSNVGVVKDDGPLALTGLGLVEKKCLGFDKHLYKTIVSVMLAMDIIRRQSFVLGRKQKRGQLWLLSAWLKIGLIQQNFLKGCSQN